MLYDTKALSQPDSPLQTSENYECQGKKNRNGQLSRQSFRSMQLKGSLEMMGESDDQNDRASSNDEYDNEPVFDLDLDNNQEAQARSDHLEGNSNMENRNDETVIECKDKSAADPGDEDDGLRQGQASLPKKEQHEDLKNSANVLHEAAQAQDARNRTRAARYRLEGRSKSKDSGPRDLNANVIIDDFSSSLRLKNFVQGSGEHG